MRTRFTILVVLAMVLTVVPLASVAAEAPDDPFVGSWEANDPRDGGTMHLRIGADHHVVGSDTISTICQIALGEEMMVSSSSFGHVDGDGMFVSEGAEYFCYPRGPGGRVSVGTEWPALVLVANPDGTLTWVGFPFVFHRTGHQGASTNVAIVTGTYTYHTFHPTHPVRTVSVSAHKADRVQGTWSSTAFWPDGPTDFSGPVTCLQVDGDDAWLAGPTWDGSSAVFMRVHDGGTPGVNGDTAVTWYTDPGETLEQMEEACEAMSTPFDFELPWFAVVSGDLFVWDIPSPGNPFVGSWEAYDSLGDDTSHNRLHITASGGWLLRDEAATACLDEGYGFVPVIIQGSGDFGFDSEPRYGDGLRFYTDDGAPAYCQPRNLLDRTFSPDFWYDSASDTLFGVGVCWWRAGVGDPSDCPG